MCGIEEEEREGRERTGGRQPHADNKCELNDVTKA